ncbi:MAG: glycosyltransferase family 4 protein, partial [candidate division WOR-3 bacterium]
VHINPSLARKSFLRDFLYMYIAKRMGYKVVLFIHGWHENVFRFFETESKLVTFFLREMLSFPDRIIVLADSFKNTLMEFGVGDSKIEVLPIMIDYAKYSQRYVSRDTSKKYVLFMSNFFKDKGLYELIRSVPLVVPTRSVENPVRFILAGDGPELRGANDLVRSLKISDHVRFTGYVTGEAKYGLYKEAALFVFPTSHGEGFPTVIAEAMAAGLPIIATRVGAIPEVIEDGVNGIILSKPDEHEVARAIIHLLKRPRLMRKMGKLNREKAKDYDVSVVCDRLVKIYDEVIA